jgi:hypothetical protein
LKSDVLVHKGLEIFALQLSSNDHIYQLFIRNDAATSFKIFCYKRGNLRKAFISGRVCLGWEDVFIVDGGMMFR